MLNGRQGGRTAVVDLAWRLSGAADRADPRADIKRCRVKRDQMVVEKHRIGARRRVARRPALLCHALGLACLAAVASGRALADEQCRTPPGGTHRPTELADRLDRLLKLGSRHGGGCGKPVAPAAQPADGTSQPNATNVPPIPPGTDPSARRGLPLQKPDLSVQRGVNLFARDENLAVLDRGHPEWDPIGVRAGEFIILPAIRIQGAYGDNVFATSTAPRADGYLEVEPRIAIESDWNQNAISLKANGVFQRYATYGNLDNNQYSVVADGVLNVHHDLTITGDIGQGRSLIPRIADAYAQFSVTPLLYDETSATVQAVQTFNYVKLTATGVFADVNYENGLTPKGLVLDQSFQNRTTYVGTLRADVALSYAVAVFVQETVGHSRLQNYLRDHDDTETLIGPNFEIARLVTAEFGLGYLTSTYASPSAKSIDSFTWRGMISYFPTELLTAKLTARQVVIDSGLPSSPTYLSRQGQLEADYELLRNLVIIGSVQGVWNKYQVIDRRDILFGATLQAKYKISHGLALDLSFTRQQRFSSGAQAGPGFGEDVAALGVTVQR
jgi:hypothetical protein